MLCYTLVVGSVKTTEPIEMPYKGTDSCWPREPHTRWGPRSPKGKGCVCTCVCCGGAAFRQITGYACCCFSSGEEDGGERQRGGGAGDAAVADDQPRRRRRAPDDGVRVRRPEGARVVRGQSAHEELNRLVRLQPAVRLHHLARSDSTLAACRRERDAQTWNWVTFCDPATQ